MDTTPFERHFGAAPQFAVRAPGRVNLIGEHTDYHDGFVMPAAIERGVFGWGRARDDGELRLYSVTFAAEHRARLDRPMGDTAGWAKRAEGIVRLVLAEQAQPRGMDLWLDGSLPVGGGLSSSAASMAAVGLAAAEVNGLALERKSFARLLQRAEHELAGVKCGIMDQLAVLLGQETHALFIDCRSLEVEPVTPPTDCSIVVVDTGVRHELASSEYNQRQHECAEALTVLRSAGIDRAALRDVVPGELEAVRDRLSAVAHRRARHVLAENARVLATRAALAAGDKRALGELFAASHESLRDDYAVSCPELDALVTAARHAPGYVASRMTGGGFGGCTVNFVLRGEELAFERAVTAAYAATGREARVVVTRAAAGARVERL